MEFQPAPGDYQANEYIDGSIPVEAYVGDDGHPPIVDEYGEGENEHYFFYFCSHVNSSCACDVRS